MDLRGVRSCVTIGQRELRRWLVALAVLSALCLLGAPERASASSADRTATHIYLKASYEVGVAFAHNRLAADTAEQRAGAAIARECPKVLAGAPGNPQVSASTGPPRTLAPRAQGEADRQQHQFSTLKDEFETTLRVDAFGIDAGPFAKFVETVSPLRWSDPAIARSVQQEISILRVLFEPGPAAAVCSDMRAWVASGYRNLSPGSLAFIAHQEGILGAVFIIGAKNPEAELKRYETPSDRALAKRTEAIHGTEIFESGGPREAPLLAALGIEEASPPVIEPKHTVIGHGVARAGGTFEIEVIKGFGPHCNHMISDRYTVTTSEGSSSSGSSSPLRCLSGGVAKARPEVRCDEGAITVQSTTLAATREVRLMLSDGRAITSRAFSVAKRDGGPAGAYFQAVPGPSPYPVSLSELDAGGTVLRTVALRAVKRCRAPQRTPHGPSTVRNLVQGKTPSGRAFTILAAASLTKGHPTVSFFASGLGASNLEAAPTAGSGPGPAAKYFPWTLTVGCERQPESIIYGQLKPPATTVLVATAATPLTALTQVPLPAALKVTGTLAYAVLTGLPTELVVRDASGRTLVREDLTARAKRETEYCEGYAEPAA